MVAVAAGMENLQGNFAAFLVYRPSDLAVIKDVKAAVEQPGERIKPTRFVGIKAAGNDQANAATGPLSKVGRQFRELV